MNTTNLSAISTEEQARMFRRLLKRAEVGEVAVAGQQVTPGALVSMLAVASLESELLFGASGHGMLFPGLVVGDIHLGTPKDTLSRSMRALMASFSEQEFAMKLPAQCRGWEAKMRKKGFTVKTTARFGQLEHVISRAGSTVTVVQGTTAVVRNKGYIGLMLDPVLAALKSAGAVVMLDSSASAMNPEEEQYAS